MVGSSSGRAGYVHRAGWPSSAPCLPLQLSFGHPLECHPTRRSRGGRVANVITCADAGDNTGSLTRRTHSAPPTRRSPPFGITMTSPVVRVFGRKVCTRRSSVALHGSQNELLCRSSVSLGIGCRWFRETSTDTYTCPRPAGRSSKRRSGYMAIAVTPA